MRTLGCLAEEVSVKSPEIRRERGEMDEQIGMNFMVPWLLGEVGRDWIWSVEARLSFVVARPDSCGAEHSG